jgi:hypothetical protein
MLVHDFADGGAQIPDHQAVAEATTQEIGVLVEEFSMPTLGVFSVEIFTTEYEGEFDGDVVIAILFAGAVAQGNAFKTGAIDTFFPLIYVRSHRFDWLADDLKETANDVGANTDC